MPTGQSRLAHRAASGAGRRPAGASGHVRWVAAQRPARAPASLVIGDLPRSMWPIRVSERKPMRWRGPGGFPPPLTGRTGWPGVKGTEPVGTPGGAPPKETAEKTMAGTTGLEPATSDVTGRRSNQLSYNSTSSLNASIPSRTQQRCDVVGGTGLEPVTLGL